MGDINNLRRQYHEELAKCPLGYRKRTDIPNIADGDSPTSVKLSQLLVKKLGHLRPGTWHFSTSQVKRGIAAFDQYEHLGHLQDILNQNAELMAALGGDYLITPDIIVARQAEPDKVINATGILLQADDNVVAYSPLRERNVPNCPRILHASISCKWTIRSDRAQNTRTEALNLIRNRKGNAPHIMAVTCEPLPNRLACLALGTGDLDCLYHAALSELLAAIDEVGCSDQKELMQSLVQGRRLRDISDLPMDLAV